MIPYIIYVSLITTICFLFYRVLLHRETFFRLNRIFFLCSLIGSFCMPFLHVPVPWSLRIRTTEKTSLRLPVPAPSSMIVDPAKESGPVSSMSSPVQGTRTDTRRIAAVDPFTHAGGTIFTPNKASSAIGRPLMSWLYYGYWCGVLLFGLNLLLQFAVLLYQVRAHRVEKEGIFRIVRTSGNRAPCSFGFYIFINPSLYDEETFQQILSHEKIHARQRHSLDIVLAELARVAQWFNPFAWWYRKAVEDNLEFLTDAAMMGNPRINPARYQMSLLKVSAPQLPLNITSNYNQSLLKKRMIMMHIKKSSLSTTWKYGFLLPLLAVMVCIFNDTTAITPKFSFHRNGIADTALPVSKQAAIKNGADINVKKDRHADAVVDLSDDKDVQIIPDEQVSADVRVIPDVQVSADVQVDPVINIDIDVSMADMNKGSWMATVRDDTVELTLRSEGEGGDSRSYDTHTEDLPKSAFSFFPTGQKGDFNVIREAGTMSFNGVFDGNEGFGHYTFKGNEDFRKYLETTGITDVTDGRMVSAFFGDVKKAYVEELVQAGFTHLSIHHLIDLSSMKVNAAYIQSWKQWGYPDLSPRELISLKSMQIDGDYVKQLETAGFKDVAVHDLVAAKSMDINAAYVKSWSQTGLTGLTLRELVGAKSMNVDAACVQSFKQVGLSSISIRELIALKSQDIDPTYVLHWKELGYSDLSARDVMSLKSMDITAAFVSGFSSLGFKDIPVRTLLQLKSRDVTPEFVTEMKNKGFKSEDLQEYIKLKNFHQD